MVVCLDANVCVFQVTFHTSDRKGAGTDANVTCQLVGEKGESSVAELKALPQAFERGSEDQFPIICNDLGAIKQVFHRAGFYICRNEHRSGQA